MHSLSHSSSSSHPSAGRAPVEQQVDGGLRHGLAAARRGRRRPPRRDRDQDVVLGWTLDNGFSLAAREKENVSTHGHGYGPPAKTMHDKELTDVKRDQNESFFNDSIIMSPNRSSRDLLQDSSTNETETCWLSASSDPVLGSLI